MDYKLYLLSKGYTDEHGYFALPQGSRTEVQSLLVRADKVWSGLAQENPISAAAASEKVDWYTKYPELVETEIDDNDKTVLDAGCGYGRIAIPLLRKHPQLDIIAVDASSTMLQLFHQLLKKENISNYERRVVLLHSGIHQLPFPDGGFDCIYSSAVLLHNPYDHVEEIIREFYRLLRPNGKLLLASSFPNLYNLEGLQNYFYSKYCISEDANGPVRPYTRNRVIKLFHNWSDLKIIPNGVVLLPRQVANIKMPFGNFIRRINSWLGNKKFEFIFKTSIFTKHFDVIAKK